MITSRLYESFQPSLLSSVCGMKGISVFILGLHPVHGRSRGFLAVAKVAGTMSKTRPRNILRVQMFLEYGDHIHKRSRSTAVRRESLH
ncbi:hypothetical protein TNCV_12441 [Trichonephila clavipes]|nr:hypothetical protein TNCV_12441 [Trichonephila clavipes]